MVGLDSGPLPSHIPVAQRYLAKLRRRIPSSLLACWRRQLQRVGKWLRFLTLCWFACVSLLRHPDHLFRLVG
jgi:hypothetical protein